MRCNRIQTATHGGNEMSSGYILQERSVKESITPHQVQRMFELDFSENENGTAFSREDQRFLKIAEGGIYQCEDSHFMNHHWNREHSPTE